MQENSESFNKHRKAIEGKLGAKITSFERIGGLTNLNYKIEVQNEEDQGNADNNKKTLVVKILSSGLDFFVDRDLERKAIRILHHNGLFPDLEYVNDARDGYIIQEYVKHTKMDKASFFSEANKELSGRVAKSIYLTLKTLNTTRRPSEETGEGAEKVLSLLEDQPNSDTKLTNFLKKFKTQKEKVLDHLRGKIPAEEHSYYQKVLNQISQKIPPILEKLKEFKQFEALCHNDICFGNILLTQTEPGASSKLSNDILIIDLEYAGRNPIFFELGNFLHGTNCRWLNQFTMLDQAHVSEDDPDLGSGLNLEGKKRFLLEFKRLVDQDGSFGFQLPEDELFVRTCHGFQALAHMYWIFLAIATCGVEGIDFDCVRYVQQKLGSFEFFLKIFLDI